MSETSTSAMLVGTPGMAAIAATIPRDEIAQALTSEPPAELILDVQRTRRGAEEPERRTVNIAWSEDDLASLLRLPGEDAVTFYFDPAELERLIEDPEVEGHGLREAAVVLSIAAAAAVGAGKAQAVPDLGDASQARVTAAAHDEASLTERGIGLQAVASTHDEAGSTARGIAPGTLPAVHDEATLVARGVDPGTLSAGHDEATLVARGIVEDTPVVVGDTGSGIEFPSVDPGTAAAVTGGLAGAGLLILGAAFATRRRELRLP